MLGNFHIRCGSCDYHGQPMPLRYSTEGPLCVVLPCIDDYRKLVVPFSFEIQGIDATRLNTEEDSDRIVAEIANLAESKGRKVSIPTLRHGKITLSPPLPCPKCGVALSALVGAPPPEPFANSIEDLLNRASQGGVFVKMNDRLGSRLTANYTEDDDGTLYYAIRVAQENATALNQSTLEIIQTLRKRGFSATCSTISPSATRITARVCVTR